MQPPGTISVIETGADPSGVKDSTASFASAVSAAQAAGQAVWVPPGNFTITAHVILNNVSLLGAGNWYSIIHGLGVGLYGNSAPGGSLNVQVSNHNETSCPRCNRCNFHLNNHCVTQIRDLSIVGEVKIRDDASQVNGIGGALSDSIITGVDITHTKVGMWLDGPFESLLISGCSIHDTTADGINFHTVRLLLRMNIVVFLRSFPVDLRASRILSSSTHMFGTQASRIPPSYEWWREVISLRLSLMQGMTGSQCGQIKWQIQAIHFGLIPYNSPFWPMALPFMVAIITQY